MNNLFYQQSLLLFLGQKVGRKITAKELCDNLGITYPTLSKKLNTHGKDFKVSEIEALSRHYGLSSTEIMNWFIGGQDEFSKE